jgi:hypothetical protein
MASILTPMKMPSTYISLLLLCGFMYVFYRTHRPVQAAGHPVNHPVVTEIKPVVKRLLPADPPAFTLDKNFKQDKDMRQTGAGPAGFSFFRNVVCRIAPLLKNIN